MLALNPVCHSQLCNIFCLVDTLERRDSFALVLVESRADDATILELNFGAGGVVLE